MLLPLLLLLLLLPPPWNALLITTVQNPACGQKVNKGTTYLL